MGLDESIGLSYAGIYLTDLRWRILLIEMKKITWRKEWKRAYSFVYVCIKDQSQKEIYIFLHQ